MFTFETRPPNVPASSPWLRGIEDVQAPSDLEVPLGVNLFLASNNPVLFGLLGSLNPFELWFVSLLSVGIARVHSISIPMGFLIAAPLWLGGITVQSTLRFLAL